MQAHRLSSEPGRLAPLAPLPMLVKTAPKKGAGTRSPAVAKNLSSVPANAADVISFVVFLRRVRDAVPVRPGKSQLLSPPKGDGSKW